MSKHLLAACSVLWDGSIRQLKVKNMAEEGRDMNILNEDTCARVSCSMQSMHGLISCSRGTLSDDFGQEIRSSIQHIVRFPTTLSLSKAPVSAPEISL